MRTPTTTFTAVVGLGSLMALFAGCNTDLNNSSGSTTDQSATGIWSGSDSVSGLGVTAIINSGGDAAFIRSDGVLFTGTVQVSGSALAVTVDGYTVFGGAAFSDGSTSGLGTLNGTVSSASTLTAALTFTTADSTAITGSWSLTYRTRLQQRLVARRGGRQLHGHSDRRGAVDQQQRRHDQPERQ